MEKDYFEMFTKEVFAMEPINFFGIAHLLGIALTTEEERRDTAEITADIFNKFQSLSNTKKKEIIKICKAANKNDRGGKHGHRTKNSKSKTK